MCLKSGYHVAEEYAKEYCLIYVFQSLARKITDICLVGFFRVKKNGFKDVKRITEFLAKDLKRYLTTR